jgi:serine phosphatase RsbU (regulator of sigma subunit)/anti-sigma regulatory factor (Ser/Thr protein kinase)
MATQRLSRRLRVPNVLASVRRGVDLVRELGAESGMDEDDLFRADLCLTEALTNSIVHGGKDAQSPETEIVCEVAGNWLRCRISDSGEPFDPASAEPPPLPTSLAAEGGAGIRLLHRFAEECQYERRAGRNVLTFVIRFGGEDARCPDGWIERGPDRRSLQRTEPVVPAMAGEFRPLRERANDDRRWNGLISRVRIFRGAAYSDLEPLLAECRRRYIAAGEVWLSPGERSPDVAVVLSGRLRIHVERKDTAPIHVIEAGHCAGEMQLLDGKAASAFVIADVDSELLLIPGDVLLKKMMVVPGVAENLLSILAGRIRRSDRLIADQVRAALELERLQRELKLAKEIQTSMLPVPPLFPEQPQVDCAGYMRPAREIGGDFYDAFPLDADRLFLTIGDICGKGLPSALFMVRTLTTLWNETARRRKPLRIVELVNRQLCNNNDTSLFVSLFCAVYDLSSRQLTYVNAGHNPPLIALGDEPFHWLASPPGLVAGILPDVVYRAGTVHLPPGSRLLFYTDGLTEAESVGNEWFGQERLLATAESLRTASMTALVDGLVDAVDSFATGREQADDVTLLAFSTRD